jgi:hypothetical protein
VNELVILIIHLAEVTKDVIEVLEIDILPPFFNQRNSHIEKIMTNALRKIIDSNLVDCLVGFNSGLKQVYSFKTKKRKNNDTKDCSFDVTHTLLLVAILNRQGICILPNRLAVSSCKINVWIGRAKVIKDRCLKKFGLREHMLK